MRCHCHAVVSPRAARSLASSAAHAAVAAVRPPSLAEVAGLDASHSFSLAYAQAEANRLRAMWERRAFWALPAAQRERALDALFFVVMRVVGTPEEGERAVELLEAVSAEYRQRSEWLPFA